MASDVVAAVVPFVVPYPSETTFDITADLGGRTPKAAILVLTGHNDEHELGTTHARIGIGFAVNGGNRGYATCRSRNAVASSAPRRASRLNSSSTGVGIIRSTVDAVAPSIWPAATAWLADTLRCAYSLSVEETTYRGFAILFAGEDLVAYAGTTPPLGTEAGVIDIDTVGFRPDLVFMASAADQGQSTISSLGSFFTLGWGVAVRDGGQMCSFLAEAAGASGGKPGSILDTSRGMLQLNAGGTTVQYRCLVEDWDEDGFSLNVDGPAADDDFPYLALQIGDRRAAVWQTSLPASTGLVADTTPGWRPQLGVLGTLGLPSPAAAYDNNAAGGFGVCGFDEAGGQAAAAVRIAATGGANTNTSSRRHVEALCAPQGDSLTVDRADLAGMLAAGWQLDVTAASGAEPVYWALALEAMAAGRRRRVPPLRLRRLGLGVA